MASRGAYPRVELVTTYFEMHAAPRRVKTRAKKDGLVILHAPHPPIHYYRYLYDKTGESCCWWERRKQTDERIAADLFDPLVDLYVPYMFGVPAGMAELDRREWPHVKLQYFGLFPDWIGKGLGGYFLDWLVDLVWEMKPCRFWLHTCNFDSPNAIPAYRAAGFQQFDERRGMIEDPRLLRP
jgi:GNAT superfamily N-acetyltransferase